MNYSAIDHFISSPELLSPQQFVHVLDAGDNLSDHLAIQCSHRSRRHEAAAASHIQTSPSQSYFMWRRRLEIEWTVNFEKQNCCFHKQELSLAVAEMGDRARAKWAEKWGLLCPFSCGSWVPIEHNAAWAEAYLRTKWHLDP